MLASPNRQVPITQSASAGIVDLPWFGWFGRVTRAVTVLEARTLPIDTAYSGVIPLAKITGGGADGSLTITNGIIVAATAPT